MDDQGENSKGHVEVTSRLIVTQACHVLIFVEFFFSLLFVVGPQINVKRVPKVLFFGVQRFIPMKWL